MKPLADRAHEGRVNPRGIPCLYMATDDVTAMMEVRPWAGSVLTISHLVLLKGVTLVDCTQAAEFNLDEPMTQRLESNNWHVLNEAFSLPVFQAEDVADYAPTQYIAEVFRAAKYDGIMYESKVGSGKNVAIFGPAIAEVVSMQLRQANNLRSSLVNSTALCKDCSRSEIGTDRRPECCVSAPQQDPSFTVEREGFLILDGLYRRINSDLYRTGRGIP